MRHRQVEQTFDSHKGIDGDDNSHHFHRVLTAFDLVLLGIGAIVGGGIFVLTGIAAATKAGPAIIISYVVAAIACGFAALSYAELAAALGGSGSAYGYAKAGFGITVAWIVGWALLLEYGIGTAAVAVGWSGYVITLIQSLNIHFPAMLANGPDKGGLFDLPSFFIVTLIAWILIIGAKTGAKLNKVIVFVKLAVVILFIVIATPHVNLSYWKNFAPFGWHGVMSGAAFIFFTYIGFDAVSTAAEETINPQRNMPIGIIGSLIVCTILYIAVSGLLTLITPYTTLNVSSPMTVALLNIGSRIGANIVAVGTIAGLTTVVLAFYYGLTRVMLAMSRDHLLPKQLARLHPKTRTPVKIIMVTWLIIGLASALIPLDALVSIVNIGTLTAFAIVCAGVLVLRYTKPDMPRPFKVPGSPWVPALGVLSCLYLIYSLPFATWLRFFIWLVIGLVFYFSYGYHRTRKPR